ncbi:hypothetical protein [Xenorhabdus bovienii]|uniref:Uncharacterized protein n=2 Tax=Xenorhabdus bovienii TaxID=40576 RepID=A0A0B6XBF0_XENBV|nr:hypothetical protein [Xenorhabdus bovienii]MCG3472381.1 hypothetical protein [Xenorhabdus bovienii]CDG86369.1 hypothetical protein XBFFR1_1030017 [Xenorhabdus bovienii str. feltiae France]CDG94238.1 hypothetical protein XBFFL1_350006 [Xenorhabdus bovienii str. feltiae Florida]CDG98185.1 hypothetical protein XBP1_2940091 [Xenorhabdus bovienii str. puntauvense]CDM91187.1 protein of unknown function [Xenorhabdus bovienii]
MERTFPLLEKLRNSVVVDCGHIIISGTSKKYRFGLKGNCSEGELLSFRTGINLVSSLRQLNKKAMLNLYLSDLSGISGGNEERYAIYEKIKSEDKCQFIPKEYVSLLEDAGFNEHDIEINLQSKGNERFKKIIKKRCQGYPVKKVTMTIESHFTLNMALYFSQIKPRRFFQSPHPFYLII